MASINTFVQDSKLKFRRIYDTKKVTMNDFTRNAIEKRVGCNDNKGIKCIGKNIKVCDSQYNISKCNNLVDRFKDEFGSFVYPSSITGPFLDKFIIFIDYLDNNSINNISLTQLEDLNTNNKFGFNTSQLQIVYSYFDASNYVENVSSTPTIFDKYYNSLKSSEEIYDIGSIDVYNTTETDYYYAIASEQDRTQQNVVEYGLKGPIEFILGTSGDPKKTTYYYTVDDWETTRIFTDKLQEDKHVFVRLKIHETDYLSGTVNMHFYSVEEGYKPSPIMTQKFIIKNVDKITQKPAGGKRIAYYIEYLSNWFDIDPTTSELIPPFTRDKNISADPFKSMYLNTNDKNLLAVYLSFLKSYKYTGPTSVNRTKLALPYGGDVVDITEAGSYTYGPNSTNMLLNGLRINEFIKTNKFVGGTGTYEGTWLSSGCLRTVSNNDTGGNPARDTSPFHGVDRVSFRINGNKMEMKTSGNCKIREASYILNASERDINTRVGKNKFGPVNEIGVTNKMSYNLYTDPSGNGSVTHTFGKYVAVTEWTPIATFLDDILNEDIGLGQKSGFPVKAKKFIAERIINVKILVSDYCEGKITDLYSRITPRSQELNITPTFGKVYDQTNVEYERYSLDSGGYAAFLIKRTGKFKSQVHPIATDYSIDDLYRLGARFDIKLLKGEEAKNEIIDNGRSWEYKSYGIDDDIQFFQSDLIHEVRYFERICYVKPNTDVYWNFVKSNTQGLRGLAIDTVTGGPSSVRYLGLNTATSYWQGINFLENYYSPNAPNSNLSAFKKSVIYSLPGVDKASDIIGWKIKYEHLGAGDYDKRIADPSKDVTYTINYVYNDVPGENEDYDPETFYLGFASINTQGRKVVSTGQTGLNYGIYVKIYNTDAGFLNTEVASSGGMEWDHPYFISPETITPVPDKDKPHIAPIEMSKYNPDTVSVFSLDDSSFPENIVYVKVISDEYLKSPWDHSLLKSEIHYRDDTEGKPDA